MATNYSEDKSASQDVGSKIAFFKAKQSALTVDTGSTRKGPPQAKSAARYSQGDNIVGTSRHSITTFEKHLSELNAKMEDMSNRKSSWSPNDMEVFKKPMCLISAEGENVLKIEDDPLQQISKIDWPMVIVSVVGLYRTGKSYLMNRLADASQGFALGDTIESKTKGIWVWCKMHPKKSNTVLLLLDTEGLGDVEKGDPSHDNRIFTLATLLCNCLVYNMKGAFDQDAVNKLTFVTAMAKNISYRGRCEEDNSSLNLILPDFVLCVRDFSLKLFKEGRTISANEYLENSLSSNKSKNEAFNKPRECIRKYFPKRECFTLPVPGDGDVLENLETLHFNDLSNKFKEATTRFVTHIYCLKPKELLASKPINGQMFTTLATEYVTALRDGAVPDVDDAFKAVAKMENERISNKALDIFEDKMKKIQNKLPIPSRMFEEQYMKFQQDALNFLRENVVHDETGDCERKAQMTMDNISNEIKKENTDKIREKCKEKVQLEFEKTVTEKLKKGDYNIAGGYKRFQQDIQKLKNDYTNSMVDYEQHEVLVAWVELMDALKDEEMQIIKADDDLSLKEKEDEKQKINKQFSDMKEAQEEKLTEALQAQQQHLQKHFETMEKEREQKRKEEAQKFEELVRMKLQKTQAEKELQDYKKRTEEMQKHSAQQDEEIKRIKKQIEEQDLSQRRNENERRMFQRERLQYDQQRREYEQKQAQEISDLRKQNEESARKESERKEKGFFGRLGDAIWNK